MCPLNRGRFTSPSAIVYDSTNSNYVKFDSSLVTIMVIDNPEPGTWQFVTEQGGDIQVEVLAADQVPTVILTEPTEVGGSFTDISLEVSDQSDTVHVSLYYDTDRDNFNGVPITSFDAINSSSVSMTWNTYDIPDGEYFIYCRVDDGENAPVMVYAPGSILISNPTTVEQPQNVSAIQMGDSLQVSWDAPLSPDVVITNVTLRDLGEGLSWTYATADTNNLIYITDFEFGMSYELWAKFEDSIGNLGPKSDLLQIGLENQSANNPPYFTFEQDSVWYCVVDQPGQTAITATDLDDNSLSYSVTSPLAGLVVSGDSLYWTPSQGQTGYHILEVIVSDGQGGADTARTGVAVLNAEQVDIDIAFSGATLYDGDNHFVTISHFNSPNSQVLVSIRNTRTSSQVDIGCTRSTGFEYTGGFKLNTAGTGLLAVEHGDTISAEYSYNSAIYTTTAVFDSTGQPSDITPPRAVVDLGYTLIGYDTLILSWTAPGDDSGNGQAMYYDLRYNYSGISIEDDYITANKYLNLGYPSGPGVVDSLSIVITDLEDIAGENYLYITIRAADELHQYSPIGNTIQIQIVPYICGDVDGSGVLPIDIADLVYLVDYMFNWGPEPPEVPAADMDNSGGLIDIADLVYLVDYMFNQGPEPACP